MFTSKLDFDLNFRSDISAPKSESLSEEYPYLGEVKSLKQSTEQLNGAIEAASKEYPARLMMRLYRLKLTVQQALKRL